MPAEAAPEPVVDRLAHPVDLLGHLVVLLVPVEVQLVPVEVLLVRVEVLLARPVVVLALLVVRLEHQEEVQELRVDPRVPRVGALAHQVVRLVRRAAAAPLCRIAVSSQARSSFSR